MITYKEYKVLKLIKTITDEEAVTGNQFTTYIMTDKIAKRLHFKEYELYDILFTLSEKCLIKQMYNEKTEEFYTVKINNHGLAALKNYIPDLLKNIFIKYIWVIIVAIITAYLTAYFTVKLTL